MCVCLLVHSSLCIVHVCMKASNYFMIGYRGPGLLPFRACSVDGRNRGEGQREETGRPADISNWRGRVPRGKRGGGDAGTPRKRWWEYSRYIILGEYEFVWARHTARNIGSAFYILLIFYLRATHDRRRYRSTLTTTTTTAMTTAMVVRRRLSDMYKYDLSKSDFTSLKNSLSIGAYIDKADGSFSEYYTCRNELAVPNVFTIVTSAGIRQ